MLTGFHAGHAHAQYALSRRGLLKGAAGAALASAAVGSGLFNPLKAQAVGPGIGLAEPIPATLEFFPGVFGHVQAPPGFTDPDTDPQLARLLVSNYNSHLRPAIGDIRFLVLALQHYVYRSLPWLTKLRTDIWDNGAYLILMGLSNDTAVRLLRDDQHQIERSQLLRLLSGLTDRPGDDDIASHARSLQAVLSDGT